jgi:hypothetical protein
MYHHSRLRFRASASALSHGGHAASVVRQWQRTRPAKLALAFCQRTRSRSLPGPGGYKVSNFKFKLKVLFTTELAWALAGCSTQDRDCTWRRLRGRPGQRLSSLAAPGGSLGAGWPPGHISILPASGGERQSPPGGKLPGEAQRERHRDRGHCQCPLRQGPSGQAVGPSGPGRSSRAAALACPRGINLKTPNPDDPAARPSPPAPTEPQCVAHWHWHSVASRMGGNHELQPLAGCRASAAHSRVETLEATSSFRQTRSRLAVTGHESSSESDTPVVQWEVRRGSTVGHDAIARASAENCPVPPCRFSIEAGCLKLQGGRCCTSTGSTC